MEQQKFSKPIHSITKLQHTLDQTNPNAQKTTNSMNSLSKINPLSKSKIPTQPQVVISYNFQHDSNQVTRTHNLLIGLQDTINNKPTFRKNLLKRVNYVSMSNDKITKPIRRQQSSKKNLLMRVRSNDVLVMDRNQKNISNHKNIVYKDSRGNAIFGSNQRQNAIRSEHYQHSSKNTHMMNQTLSSKISSHNKAQTTNNNETFYSNKSNDKQKYISNNVNKNHSHEKYIHSNISKIASRSSLNYNQNNQRSNKTLQSNHMHPNSIHKVNRLKFQSMNKKYQNLNELNRNSQQNHKNDKQKENRSSFQKLQQRNECKYSMKKILSNNKNNDEVDFQSENYHTDCISKNRQVYFESKRNGLEAGEISTYHRQMIERENQQKKSKKKYRQLLKTSNFKIVKQSNYNERGEQFHRIEEENDHEVVDVRKDFRDIDERNRNSWQDDGIIDSSKNINNNNKEAKKQFSPDSSHVKKPIDKSGLQIQFSRQQEGTYIPEDNLELTKHNSENITNKKLSHQEHNLHLNLNSHDSSRIHPYRTTRINHQNQQKQTKFYPNQTSRLQNNQNNKHQNPISSSLTKRKLPTDYNQFLKILAEENQKKQKLQELQKEKEKALIQKNAKFESIIAQNQHIKRIMTPIRHGFLEDRHRRLSYERKQKERNSIEQEKNHNNSMIQGKIRHQNSFDHKRNGRFSQYKSKSPVENKNKKMKSLFMGMDDIYGLRSNSLADDESQGNDKSIWSNNRRKRSDGKGSILENSIIESQRQSDDKNNNGEERNPNNKEDKKRNTEINGKKEKQEKGNRENKVIGKLAGMKVPAEVIERANARLNRKNNPKQQPKSGKPIVNNKKNEDNNKDKRDSVAKNKPHVKTSTDKRQAKQKQRKFKNWKNSEQQQKQKQQEDLHAAKDKQVHSKEWKWAKQQKTKKSKKNKNNSQQGQQDEQNQLQSCEQQEQENDGVKTELQQEEVKKQKKQKKNKAKGMNDDGNEQIGQNQTQQGQNGETNQNGQVRQIEKQMKNQQLQLLQNLKSEQQKNHQLQSQSVREQKANVRKQQGKQKKQLNDNQNDEGLPIKVQQEQERQSINKQANLNERNDNQGKYNKNNNQRQKQLNLINEQQKQQKQSLKNNQNENNKNNQSDNKKKQVIENLIKNQELQQNGFMEITQSKFQLYNHESQQSILLNQTQSDIMNFGRNHNNPYAQKHYLPNRAEIVNFIYSLPEKYQQEIDKFHPNEQSNRLLYQNTFQNFTLQKELKSIKSQKLTKILQQILVYDQIRSTAFKFKHKNSQLNQHNNIKKNKSYLSKIFQPYQSLNQSYGVWLFCVGVWRLIELPQKHQQSQLKNQNKENFLFEILQKAIQIALQKYYSQLKLDEAKNQQLLKMITGLRISILTKTNKNRLKIFKEIQYNIRKTHIIRAINTESADPKFSLQTINCVRKIQNTPTGQKVIQIVSYSLNQNDSIKNKEKYFWIKEEKFLEFFNTFTIISKRNSESYWTNKLLEIKNLDKAVYMIDSNEKHTSGSITIYPQQIANQKFNEKCTIAFYKQIEPQVLKLVGRASEKLPQNEKVFHTSKLYFEFNIKGTYFVFLQLQNGEYNVAIQSNSGGTSMQFVEFVKKETMKNEQCQYVEIDKIFKKKPNVEMLQNSRQFKQLLNFMKKTAPNEVYEAK